MEVIAGSSNPCQAPAISVLYPRRLPPLLTIVFTAPSISASASTESTFAVTTSL